MKICFLLNNLELGGAERVIAILSDYLVHHNCDVSIIVLNKLNNQQALNPNIEIISLNQNKVLSSFLPLRNLLKKNKYDFIIGNMWPITILGLVASFLSFKKSHIFFIEHSIISNEYNHQSFVFQRILKSSIRFFYNFSSQIICVSNGVANDLQKLGVKKSKLKVILNPVDIEPTPGDHDQYDQYSSNWKDFTGIKILSVGNLRKNKNYPNLFKALKILRDKYNQHFISLIAGDGPEKASLKLLIQEYDLEDQVILLGEVQYTEGLYRNADLFVLSSDYEGFGMVLVEALGYGKTIVATDCESGPREILGNSEHGYLCSVDSPERLAESIYEAYLNKLSPDILLARYNDFDISLIGKKYLSLMQKMQSD
jgi:glycosyltransferase involved in cell wall biosynthesis|tara:strand:- start:5050 stop:6156 length:1107 start_codon:yes stop_codon:yes gene_type:complete